MRLYDDLLTDYLFLRGRLEEVMFLDECMTAVKKKAPSGYGSVDISDIEFEGECAEDIQHPYHYQIDDDDDALPEFEDDEDEDEDDFDDDEDDEDDDDEFDDTDDFDDDDLDPL